MKQADAVRVQDLMRRLERLEAQVPRPEEAAIHAVAQRAIVEEIRRLVPTGGLAVYRNGSTLDAVSMI